MKDHERTKIIITLLVAIIISLIINIILLNTLVDVNLAKTDRIVNIFAFYDQMKGNSENKIFFIGSSQIAGDVDSLIIEDYLKINNISIPIYNLGYSADTPLRRLTELTQIIESKPTAVYIGLTYYGLNNSSFPISSDSLALASNYIRLDSHSRSLFEKEDLDLMELSPLERQFYKRKFIIPGIKNLIMGKSRTDEKVATDFKVPQDFEENLTSDLLRIRLNNSRDMLDNYVVSARDNPQKRALNYTISQLIRTGIHVFVINMPLNPLLSDKISRDSRSNYYSFLNQANAPCYDFESKYPLNCFSDLTHLNEKGRRRFSEDTARIIAKGCADR